MMILIVVLLAIIMLNTMPPMEAKAWKDGIGKVIAYCTLGAIAVAVIGAIILSGFAINEVYKTHVAQHNARVASLTPEQARAEMLARHLGDSPEEAACEDTNSSWSRCVVGADGNWIVPAPPATPWWGYVIGWPLMIGVWVLVSSMVGLFKTNS